MIFQQVSILPLRLHVDQDTLTFMNEFSAALAEAGCQQIDGSLLLQTGV